MDKTYSYKVEHLEDFENQPMLRETKVLLALIYRDYLVTPEERKNLNEKIGQAKNKSKGLFAQADIHVEKDVEEETQTV